VRRDATRLCGRTAGEEFLDGSLHAHGEITVLIGAAHLLALAPGCSLAGVVEAFLFGLLECGFLHQDSLALVVAPSPAEAYDHSRKGTVLRGSSRKGGVASGQVDEMIKIGAPEAQWPSMFQEKEIALP
jgi:hypothetical protein